MNAFHASKPTMEGLLTSMDPSDPQFYTHLKAAADGDISYGTPSCTSELVVDFRPSFSTILDHPRQCSNVRSLWPRPRGAAEVHARACAGSSRIWTSPHLRRFRERIPGPIESVLKQLAREQ